MSEPAELSCKEAARLMSRQRDAALTPDEQASLKYHLFDCLNCRHFDKQLDFLSRLARRYGDTGPPAAEDPV